MKKSILMMTMAAAAMLISSCASKKDLVACQEENKTLQANYTETKEQLAAAKTRVASLEQQLAQQEKATNALQVSLDKSLSNASQNNVSIEKLVDQINESNQYIRHLVEVKSKSDSLNMVLTNNLTRSLSKEELKEVDVQVLKGVVYISLADNMLYKSGSYEINDRASETLSKIAKIIKACSLHAVVRIVHDRLVLYVIKKSVSNFFEADFFLFKLLFCGSFFSFFFDMIFNDFRCCYYYINFGFNF